jgi:hypothetical protein
MAIESATIAETLGITSTSEPHTGWAHGMRRPISEADLSERGYGAAEYVIEGAIDGGKYRTTLLLRMPVDPHRFSGLVLLETLHSRGHCTIWPSTWDYLVAEGHGYALVVSQKESLDGYLRSARSDRYAGMSIPPPLSPGRGSAGLPPGLVAEANADSMKAMIESTPSSLAILGQVGALIKENGTLFGAPVRQVVMSGMSQTGGQTLSFIQDAHRSAVFEDGRFVYDGFLPLSAFGAEPVPPSGVPIVHVVDEAEILMPPLTHRRGDGDEDSDLYRLYELPGCPHVPTRGMSKDAAAAFFAALPGGPGPTGIPDISRGELTQFPFSFAYRAIVVIFLDWVTKGVVPPHAPPIQTAGDDIVRDEHGNALGGVRHSYLEVPRAAYLGTFVGFQEPFDTVKLRRLYGDEAGYVARVEASLRRLVAERFLLPEHAADLLDEAKAFQFGSVAP